jgi:uncharacterized damage-inducible protein DinB
MPQLEDFVATWESEFQTTVRVFENYPADRLAYRPHEVSRTAHELMWTIAYEEGEMIKGCLRGKITFAEEKPPKTKEALIREYKKRHADLVKKVRKAGEGLFSKKVDFSAGKGKLMELSGKDWLWSLLHDQIHHRGQLSVYLRLVGAKVPSIYGPSADEPW